MIKNKKISVCMTSHNGSLYIFEQIQSILRQLRTDDELIISDDNSSDETIKIIESFHDERIKLFHVSFHNHIKNFEFALSKCTGDYIFLSDQDDVWLENKVVKMLSILETQGGLILSNCIVTNKDLKPLHDFFSDDRKKMGFCRNFIKNNYLGCCLAFDRKVLHYVLPFPKKLITHDMWIGLIADIVSKTSYINDKLIFFRRHENNTSTTCKKSPYNFFQKINYRIIILFGLIKNILFKINFNNVQK